MPSKNVYSNLKPVLYADALPVYASAFYAARLSPLERVTVTGLARGANAVTLEAECAVGGLTVFAVKEKTFSRFDTSLFELKSDGSAVFTFDFADFTTDAAFLFSLDAVTDAKIRVTLTTDGDTETTADIPIRLLPHDVFAGIEVHPETFLTFVEPCDPAIKQLGREIERLSPYASREDVTDTLSAVVRSIRQRGIICANRDSYSPERRQKLRAPSVVLEKSTAVASTDELAVIFASLAESVGLMPVFAFVRGSSGTLTILCGIRTDVSDALPMLSESLSALRALTDAGRVLLFEPSTLSAAQNTDIFLSVKRGSDCIRRRSGELLLIADILAARETGVSPKSGQALPPYRLPDTPRDVLALRYTSLTARPVFSLLDGKYDGFCCLPFISPSFDALFEKLQNGTALMPLELSDRVDAFAGIDDGLAGFSHFLAGTGRDVPFNKAEAQTAAARRDAFSAELADRKGVCVGMYEKAFAEAASRMAFSDEDAAGVYIIGGFLRVKEHAGGGVRYMPLCFKKAVMTYDGGYFVRLCGGPVVPNYALAAFFDDGFTEFSRLTTVREAFEAFRKMLGRAPSGVFREADLSLIEEAAAVRCSLCDAIHWNDIRLYAKKMLTSRGFADSLTSSPAVNDGAAGDRSSVTVLPLPHDATEAAARHTDVLVNGQAVSEKLDIAVSRAAYELAEKHTVLVTSDSREFLDAFDARFAAVGLGKSMIRLSAMKDTAALIAHIRSTDTGVRQQTRMYSEKLAGYRASLDAVSRAFGDKNGFTGMTLYETAENYLSACFGTEDIPPLPIDRAVFDTLDAAAFDDLFAVAQKLISTGNAANTAVGKSAASPLSAHPLAAVCPPMPLSARDVTAASSDIARILPALAEYRETLYALEGAMDIGVRDIKSVAALGALNEIYRLILSGRELAIPPSLGAGDYAALTGNADRMAALKKRQDALTYQLRFLTSEAFEDIDHVLAGYDETVSDQAKSGSFLKKFLFRRGSREMLMPYVVPEKKGEFAAADMEDVYAKLYEYRSVTSELAVADGDGEKSDNAVKLGTLARKLAASLKIIYPDEDGTERQTRRVTRIISLIAGLDESPSLAKTIMSARARFAEVVSDEECLLGRVEKTLYADFSALTFSGGILSYDGLSETLKNIADNLPSIDVWTRFLAAANEAKTALPSFVGYLYENGIPEHTDRLFAKSLLMPAVRRLLQEKLSPALAKEASDAETNYAAVWHEACAEARVFAANVCAERARETLGTGIIDKLLRDASMPLYAFAAKHLDTLFALCPCILCEREHLLEVTGGREAASCVILCDTARGGEWMLPVLSAGESVLAVDDTYGKSAVARSLASRGVYTVCARRHMSACHPTLLAYASPDSTVYVGRRNATVQLVTVNGVMRRSADLANPSEAEAMLSKAAERLAAGAKNVALFTLTHGQYAYVRHLLAVTAQKDAHMAKLFAGGALRVIQASAPFYGQFEEGIVSIGAAPDNEGHIGWHYGAHTLTEALGRIGEAVRGNVTFVMSLGAKELSRIRRVSRETSALADLSAFLATGILPCRFAENGFTPDAVTAHMLSVRRGSRLCKGYLSCGGSVISYDGVQVLTRSFAPDGYEEDRMLTEVCLREAGCRVVSVSAADDLADNDPAACGKNA